MVTRAQFFDLITIALLGFTLIQWFATIRMYRFLPRNAIKRMMQLAWRTVKAFLVGSSLLAMLGAVGIVLLPDRFEPLPVSLFSQLTFGLCVISFVYLPPSILLLGVSDQTNAGLYYEVMCAALPLKLVHMLNDFNFGAIHGGPLNYFRYRALPIADWKAVISDLMLMAPIIVMDIRIVTKPVLDEVNMILSLGLCDKTIFVINQNGSSQVLDLIRNTTDQSVLPINTIRSDQVISSLRSMKYRLLFG